MPVDPETNKRVEKKDIENALVEWWGLLEVVLKIEQGMIVMTISEYERLSWLFLTVWQKYKHEKAEYERERELKRRSRGLLK